MRAVPLLVLLAVLTLPPAAAKADGPDFRVEIALRDSPVYEGPAGWLHLVEATPGERYVWNVSVPAEYAAGQFHVTGLDLQRPRQLVPTLETPGVDYPLFESYPDERVWEAGGTVRVFHIAGAAADFTLSLGIPQGNHTLVLQRDVTPPVFALGPIENLTHRDFYRETRTDELVIADLQTREAGATEWVQNPTPVYHVRQRFPIQGLDAATEHEARLVFTDWAGNEVTTPIERFTTLAAPVVPKPVVTLLDPPANATLQDGAVTIRARIVSNESSLEGGDIRLFLDKKAVREGLAFDGEVFSYRPPQPLGPGPHSVAVEATNAAGGTGVATWTFTVQGAEARAAPGPGLAPLLLLVGLAGVALRRR
jgi:hypothetical protein